MSLIGETIIDQQRLIHNEGIRRNLAWEYVPKKAFVCLGVRRSGKSTFLFQMMQELKNSGVDSQRLIYLNLFDDRFNAIHSLGFGVILDEIWMIFPELQNKKLFFFLDEPQEIPGWEPFVERLLREGHQVFITGSSAKLLSQEIATQMRGRSLSWELFPFDFGEFLNFKKIKKEKIDTTKKAVLRNAYKEYTQTGGFPEVLALSQTLRIKIHQEYFHTMLYRDIIERHDAPHPKAILDLSYRLLSQCGSLYTINRLTEYLRSMGHKTDKNFVSSCLNWFEDCYFLFSIKLFDRSLARQNVNPKKIYCVDHSLIASINPLWGREEGHLLENMVFVFLRRQSFKPCYYKTKSGREIDFIYTDPKGEKQLIQVCHDMNDEKTAQRELGALNEAIKELKLKSGLIVTTELPYRNRKQLPKGISLIPAWQFFAGTR